MLKGTSLLRERNKRKTLSFIRRLGETSRQDLVKLMSVSKNTVSLVVDEFIKEGIIHEIGVKEPGRKGRPKILIKINKDSFRSIGFSISKIGISYAVIDYYGDIVEEDFFQLDGTNAHIAKEKLLQLVDDSVAKYDNIIGIGIGIPGIVNTDRKIVHTSTHLGWEDVTLQELEKYNVPIYVQNSVNMGAIDALDKEGQFEGESSFYVRIGEGVGGTFLFENNLMNGNSWTAGEIGHISIDSNGEKCDCGQRGCLELLINHLVFQEQLKKLGYGISIKGGNITFDADFLQSDAINEIVTTNGQYLGKALVQVIHLINPATIIVDTSYNTFEKFSTSCREYMEQNALNISYSETKIVFGHKRYNLARGAALSSIMNYEQYVV